MIVIDLLPSPSTKSIRSGDILRIGVGGVVVKNSKHVVDSDDQAVCWSVVKVKLENDDSSSVCALCL